MTCDFHRLGASISPGKEKPCREAQRHGIVTFGFDPLVNLPVFSICTKCLDGSELGIFYTEGEAPQWDFRHRLENGIRSQKKLPLPLLFENLKVVGVGGGEQHRCCSRFLLWCGGELTMASGSTGFALLTCQTSGGSGSSGQLLSLGTL